MRLFSHLSHACARIPTFPTIPDCSVRTFLFHKARLVYHLFYCRSFHHFLFRKAIIVPCKQHFLRSLLFGKPDTHKHNTLSVADSYKGCPRRSLKFLPYPSSHDQGSLRYLFKPLPTPVLQFTSNMSNTETPFCIRCPSVDDAKTNKHKSDNNFEACRLKYQSTPANELWWGFTDNAHPTKELGLRHLDTCRAVLEQAKSLDALPPGSKAPKGSAKLMDFWNASTKKKEGFKFGDVPVTKQMLEAAMNNLVVDANTTGPDAETEGKQYASEAEEAEADLVEGVKQASLGDNPDADSTDPCNSSQLSGTITPADQLDIVCPRYCGLGLSHRDSPQFTTKMPQQAAALGVSPGNPAHAPLTIRAQPSGDAQKDQTKKRDRMAEALEKSLKGKSEVEAKAMKKPTELYPLRQDFTTLPGHQVLTNFIQVTLPPKVVLHEYVITGFPSKCTRAKRRMFILDMLEMHKDLYSRSSSIASDHFNKLISSKQLHDDGDAAGTVVCEVRVPNFQSGVRADRIDTLVLKLQFVTSHSMEGLNDFVNGRDETYTDRGAVDALNIVLSKGISDNQTGGNTFLAGKNRFYYRPGYDRLDCRSPALSNLLSIRGYHASIKPGLNTVLLNINTVTSAFYSPATLDQYLTHFAKSSGRANSGPLWERLLKHVKGLRVYVNFSRLHKDNDPSIDRDSRRIKTLADVGKYPEDQDVTVDGASTSVWNHVQNKYPSGSPADAKNYPTGNVGHSKKPNQKFYLATQLTVLSDQLYRRSPMPAEVTQQMITTARRRPEVNSHAIVNEGLASLRTPQGTLPKILQDLGINIGTNLVSVPAYVYIGPRISLGKGVTISTDHKGLWDFPKTSMKLAATTFPDAEPAKMQFFRTDNMKFPHQEVHYLKNFYKLHAADGLRQLEPLNGSLKFDPIIDWSLNGLQEHLKSFKDKIALAIVVFPDSDADTRDKYANFKIVCDQYLGIRSVCLNEGRMLSSIGKSVAKDLETTTALTDVQLDKYMRNLSMKINLRFGNYNHTVNFDRTISKIEGTKTIILGADVTHPGGGSFDGTPSIAAVVGSVDPHFARFLGSMRLNPSRQETIDERMMVSMTQERIMEWSKFNRYAMPENILFYRDGVADTQYGKVRQKELNAIRKAWNNAFDQIKKRHNIMLKKNPNMPNVTAVIVTKRHNTRLFPLDALHKTDRGGNCKPGLVVDAGITSPYYMDFYLQSNIVPDGATARPTHYFVIENKMNIPARELQQFTYELCFTYARANNAVSYAPPAYYADRLCERGRLYLRPFHDKRAEYEEAGYTPDEIFQKAAIVFYNDNTDHNKNPWHTFHNDKMFWM